uniref:Secreted protein n=1 Tax=Fagus sylvatica TaxID=28930 RepID=A0A2N9IP77_FAGSY
MVVKGVVVDWWLGLADLGVVVAWACRSCRSRPGFAAKERSTSLATPRSTNHHRNRKACRQALPCRSQRSGGGEAVPISAWRSGSQPGGGGAVPIGC